MPRIRSGHGSGRNSAELCRTVPNCSVAGGRAGVSPGDAGIDLRLVAGPWRYLPERARAALDAVSLGLEAPGAHTLPRLQGVDAAVVGRWLYRRWLPEGAAAPFVHVDTRHLGPRPAAEGLAAAVVPARGGILLLEGELTAAERDAVHRAAVEQGARVLLPDGAAVPVGAEVEALAPAWDALHAVAVDPTLANTRALLVTLLRPGAAVEVVGPTGSGRRALVAWARLALAPEEAMRIVGPTAEVPPGKGWVLFEDADTRTSEHREELLRVLRAREARPAPHPQLPRSRPPARPDDPAFGAIVGESPALIEMLEAVRAVAPVGREGLKQASVLVLGESGAGKQAVARAIHDLSGRSGPFVQVDLGAIPETLAEATLFGAAPGLTHAPGPGRFEEARGGTLFIDEVGNASLAVQQKLMVALEEFQGRRVGNGREYPIEARLVFATNRDLRAMVERGEFMLDLYQRLARRSVHVPPLRHRVVDIPRLARAILARKAPELRFTDAALARLREYPWPANVRELENCVEAARLSAKTPVIDAGDLVVGQSTDVLVWTTRERLSGVEGTPFAAFSVAVVPVPGHRDRPGAVKEAVRAALAPRPALPDAVERLAGAAWWGGFRQLRESLSSAANGPDGPADEAFVRALFPGHLAPARPAPLVLMLHAHVVGDRVFSLDAVFEREALVLGRATGAGLAGWAEAVRAGTPPKGEPTRDDDLPWLVAFLEGRAPERFDFGNVAHLSRLHVAVRQEGAGIRVGRFPGSRLPVWVVSVFDGASRELGPGESIRTGPVAEIVPLIPGDQGSTAMLRAFVCRGRHEQDLLADYLKNNDEGSAQTALPGVAPAAAPGRRRPVHVWRLSEAESEALAAGARAFVESGAAGFGAWLGAFGAELEDRADTATLGRFLDRATSGERNTYLRRLVEFEANAPTREALRRALSGVPPEKRYATPAWLEAIVGPAGESA